MTVPHRDFTALRSLSSSAKVVPEYRRLQFTIADLLAAMLMLALLLGEGRLPPSALQAILLLAVLYVVKFRILTFRVQPWLGLLLYFFLVVGLLLYLYVCVLDIWNNGQYDKMAKWIGAPIIIFAVPTAFVLRDILSGHPLSEKYLAWEFLLIRSVLEIVVLIPVWGCVCIFAMDYLRWFHVSM